jgi:D-3-phosphoglycerate dehydrogenase
VVLTPHIGAQTREAQLKAALDIAGEVLAALRGEPLRWRVV